MPRGAKADVALERAYRRYLLESDLTKKCEAGDYLIRTIFGDDAVGKRLSAVEPKTHSRCVPGCAPD